MVLSNVSMGISSAFSSDLISTTPFRLYYVSSYSPSSLFHVNGLSFLCCCSCCFWCCRFIKCPKEPGSASSVLTDEEKQLKKRKSAEADIAEVTQAGAFTSATNGNIVYRVKKDGAFGSYKVVTESISSSASRENMLDQRSKKKSDRYSNTCSEIFKLLDILFSSFLFGCLQILLLVPLWHR